MRKLLVFTILPALFLTAASSQNPVRLRSVSGSGGSSAYFISAGKNYYIQHNIGQGVTGLGKNKNYIMRQGFIQPPVKALIAGTGEILPVSVSPNPFTGEIIISFPGEMEVTCFVDLADLSGKIIYRKKHSASQELRINPGHLLPGAYFLRVTTSGKIFTTRIISL